MPFCNSEQSSLTALKFRTFSMFFNAPSPYTHEKLIKANFGIRNLKQLERPDVIVV